MRDIEKEQRAAEVLRQQEKAARELIWARSRRDVLLMRHPTNWAGASLLQVCMRVYVVFTRPIYDTPTRAFGCVIRVRIAYWYIAYD